MNRTEGWPARLKEFLKAAEKRPFSWKKFNCCLFSCNGVEVQTGFNPASLFPVDRVTNRRTATRAIKSFAGSVEDTARTIAGQLSMREVSPLAAGRGDVVLLDEGGGALGLVDLRATEAVFMTETGLVWRPLSVCQTAWRIE